MIERMLVEILAIKLYEHDHATFPPAKGRVPWSSMCVEDREIYRDKARALADSRNREPFADEDEE